MSSFSLLRMSLSRTSRKVSSTPVFRSLSSVPTYNRLTVSLENGLRVISLNRPEKYNAFDDQMYMELQEDLGRAGEDENTVIAAVTGTGKYFSSGNDMNAFAKVEITADSLAEFARKNKERTIQFVDAFINFPKPLVGVVNGPTIGIGCTILGLFDVVYASERATFHVPFTHLALTPEGCSSHMFPRIMGPARAMEMLLFNKKLSASEAAAAGFVTSVFKHQDLESQVWPMVKEFANLSKNSLICSKSLVREREKEILLSVNRRECETLEERWKDQETFTEAMKFLKRK